jgi:hypothetical protein
VVGLAQTFSATSFSLTHTVPHHNNETHRATIDLSQERI